MNFDKLFQLIQESVQIGLTDYSNKLKSAYKVFFDLDDSDVIEVQSREGAASSYTHNVFKVNIEFYYKSKKYKIYHSLLHYKIPYKTIKQQPHQEWDDFLKKLETFDYVPLTDDLIKNKNIQVRTLFHIYEIQDQQDRFGMQDRILLESGEMYVSLAEIVKYIKNVIDGNDDNDNPEEFEPSPTSPNEKLVPA